MITYNRTDLLRIRNLTGTGLHATADGSITPLCTEQSADMQGSRERMATVVKALSSTSLPS